MVEGTKVCLALDGANEDVGTVIQTTGIHKVRVLWWDGEETSEETWDLKEVTEFPTWANGKQSMS